MTDAGRVVDGLRRKGWTIATAESCTGGMVAAHLTDIAGSSDVFDRGFVTYSNRAKAELLGIPAELIAEHGAVSEAVARAMAEGAAQMAGVDITVAITGIAGPGGGSVAKPVGLVHFATCANGETRHEKMEFGAIGRAEVRLAATVRALQLVLERL